ncbi:MAG TPA: hypothetical protein VFW33_05155 [Gemmataceae bacterium]|nr:hypothetical protein [Gemmataceae bacterium]
MAPLFCLLLLSAPADSSLYQPAFSMDHELRAPAVPYVPQPGDVFLCSGREMWAKLGHWAAGTGAPQHSGIVFARPDGTLALLEAGPDNSLRCGVHDLIPQLQNYAGRERVWIRRRRVPLTAEQSAALSDFARCVEGRRFALVRMFLQVTPLRSRGRHRTEYFGGPHGLRSSYFCSELVTEACVTAGLLDCVTTRPAAMYPRDLFFGRSNNPYIDRHLDMSGWDPPARWTLRPGTETAIRRFPYLDGDTE